MKRWPGARDRVLVLTSLLAVGLGAVAASGAPVTIRFDQLGSYERSTFEACGATVTASGGQSPSLIFGPAGLGVLSTLSTNYTSLDSGEKLTVAFPALGATGVSYAVQSAGNQNGTGDFGDAFVEAFTPADVSLGVVAVSGAGTQFLADFFGPGPIGRFSITATQDSQRIGGISFSTPPGSVLRLDLGSFAVYSMGTPTLSLCGVSLAGSGDLYVDDLGLGIFGSGPVASLIDGFEWVEVNFDLPTSAVAYSNVATNDDKPNGIRGESFLEAFGSQGSLGIRAVDSGGLHPVSALFGDQPITGFRITADVDAQTLRQIEYAPEAPTSIGAVAALLALALRARRGAARSTERSPLA